MKTTTIRQIRATTQPTSTNPAGVIDLAVDADIFIDHVLAEHSQFLDLLESTRLRVQAFLDGDTTIGALARLVEDIAQALPATIPTPRAQAIHLLSQSTPEEV